ncbi:MAG: hypothetical protein DCO97_19225 [Marivita sp. XM-24bin2]|nr:MAG: hypothetical protein DCO97_19225 [Marivita sp. XM-24bin2]
MASVPERHQRLAVVVVGHVMAVTVHRPVEVFLESMRMPVIGDHLQMILDRVEHGWRVSRGGHDGPDDQRQAEKHCKRLSSECRQRSHRSCLSVHLRGPF